MAQATPSQLHFAFALAPPRQNFFARRFVPCIFGMSVFYQAKKKIRLAFFVRGGFSEMSVLE
jgi:hypothetical protein